MIQESPTSAELIKVKMKSPIYIWIGTIAMSIYYTWKAFDVTGSTFHLQFSTFDSSNPTMWMMSLFAVIAGLLAWLIPAYMLRLGSTQGPRLSIRFVAFVLRLALIGSINLYGLVLAVTTKDANVILPFTIMSLLGYIRSYPQPKTFGFDLA